jgi:hypothetical protein
MVPWEPAIFAELASIGSWDERLNIDMITAHRFAFIVTTGDRGDPTYDLRFTPAADRAIRTAYPVVQEAAGRRLHLAAPD